MTTQQLHLFNCLYMSVLVVVAFFTRATARRIAGALAGAGVGGVAALGIIALGEKVGWWHMAITWEPYFLTVLWIDFALCAYIFLITWRIARRFGWRGLAVVVVVAAFVGPLRDYWYMARFPEWGAYGPGIVPVLAIAATYFLLGVLGHGVMRLVAGHARGSPLARRPWETAEPSDAADAAGHVAFLDFRLPKAGRTSELGRHGVKK
ncbi:hypothetical protein [Lacipirellula limnantheis]|uniref:Uncharacterized protein n=1 Tax=Lacipirellula limnantheis TaxID=2528024 RepID=A0A517TY08_9BACT|nr:hypothetical protein [Lacipirellula limnantheis]QDT73264.1 hypothetical protein I41_24530 [Lacipirellula limnantheis]